VAHLEGSLEVMILKAFGILVVISYLVLVIARSNRRF
jgi:CHASE1-domain containing sensor protein